MFESLKTKKIWNQDELNYLSGKGLDIGCGPWPVTEDARGFDLEDGDANNICEYIKDEFDFVYASHVLEHMKDPYKSIKDWFSLVKNGGQLIILVPDEDLYEQEVFPSIFNKDHKWTFTLSKRNSWSEKSINILNLIKTLNNYEIISLELQDDNYDRTFKVHKKSFYVIFITKIFNRIISYMPFGFRKYFAKLGNLFGVNIDQTAVYDNVLAQIQIILKKNEQ